MRVDSGVRAGSVMSPMYDPMVAKLIVWDADREQATARMLRALAEFEIGGLKTLIGFHRALLASEQWARGETCRDLLEDRAWLEAARVRAGGAAAAEADDGAEPVEQTYAVEVSGRRFDVRVIGAAARRRRGGAGRAGAQPARATPKKRAAQPLPAATR